MSNPSTAPATPRARTQRARTTSATTAATSHAPEAPAAKAPARAKPSKALAKAVPAPKVATPPAPAKKTAAPTPVLEPAGKAKKPKLVRDSFTIPKNEFDAITTLKQRAMTLGVGVKKSELLRAGLMTLAFMSDAAFAKALANVPTLKTGRPSAKAGDKKSK